MGASGPDGSGIVVALFDSGIGGHPDLQVEERIRTAVDFTTGEPVQRSRNVDEYGHGTAVAGIIGGAGLEGIPTGVAPGVQFVDVKVIGPDGTGSTSNLIKAIEWLIRHRNRYKVRVANMSLGHPPLESYKKDPLCRAVSKMVSAGVVTIVSAGNLGRTQSYPKLWGSITTPGNEPSVITVSAIDTMGTSTHSDDVATPFGSRGPTYKDNLFKPDISAPGKSVKTLLESGSWIERNHPELRLGESYGVMSGSSMASAFAAGAAALMLQENPRLTPDVCKLMILWTAIKLEHPHMLEQGNGLLNVHAAVSVAQAIDLKHRGLRKLPESLEWTNEGGRVVPGGAIAVGNTIIYGEYAHSRSSRLWGSGRIWSDGVFCSGIRSRTCCVRLVKRAVPGSKRSSSLGLEAVAR